MSALKQKDLEKRVFDQICLSKKKWEDVMTDVSNGIVDRDRIVRCMDDFNIAIKGSIDKYQNVLNRIDL